MWPKSRIAGVPAFDTTDAAQLLEGMRLARGALKRGELVVIPTDTVYGIAAEAFAAPAVQRLLDAKGRDRTAPPPVLVPGLPTLDALAETVPDEVRSLVDAFWPGGLTVILRARPTLDWDLGETRGPVARRLASPPNAREQLAQTGPLAVSSANKTGRPAATTAAEAEEQLGDAIEVYLEAGPSAESYAPEHRRSGSTIVDATGLEQPDGKLTIVRHGVIPDEEIIRVVGADRCG
jgi:tRNA threonylcarbamoyl adenosine modification protein (Sua5/YciO/YrdC/YwlC family)